jgi:hypothetical protein
MLTYLDLFNMLKNIRSTRLASLVIYGTNFLSHCVYPSNTNGEFWSFGKHFPHLKRLEVHSETKNPKFQSRALPSIPTGFLTDSFLDSCLKTLSSNLEVLTLSRPFTLKTEFFSKNLHSLNLSEMETSDLEKMSTVGQDPCLFFEQLTSELPLLTKLRLACSNIKTTSGKYYFHHITAVTIDVCQKALGKIVSLKGDSLIKVRLNIDAPNVLLKAMIAWPNDMTSLSVKPFYLNGRIQTNMFDNLDKVLSLKRLKARIPAILNFALLPPGLEYLDTMSAPNNIGVNLPINLKTLRISESTTPYVDKLINLECLPVNLTSLNLANTGYILVKTPSLPNSLINLNVRIGDDEWTSNSLKIMLNNLPNIRRVDLQGFIHLQLGESEIFGPCFDLVKYVQSLIPRKIHIICSFKWSQALILPPHLKEIRLVISEKRDQKLNIFIANPDVVALTFSNPKNSFNHLERLVIDISLEKYSGEEGEEEVIERSQFYFDCLHLKKCPRLASFEMKYGELNNFDVKYFPQTLENLDLSLSKLNNVYVDAEFECANLAHLKQLRRCCLPNNCYVTAKSIFRLPKSLTELQMSIIKWTDGSVFALKAQLPNLKSAHLKGNINIRTSSTKLTYHSTTVSHIEIAKIFMNLFLPIFGFDICVTDRLILSKNITKIDLSHESMEAFEAWKLQNPMIPNLKVNLKRGVPRDWIEKLPKLATLIINPQMPINLATINLPHTLTNLNISVAVINSLACFEHLQSLKILKLNIDAKILGNFARGSAQYLSRSLTTLHSNTDFHPSDIAHFPQRLIDINLPGGSHWRDVDLLALVNHLSNEDKIERMHIVMNFVYLTGALLPHDLKRLDYNVLFQSAHSRLNTLECSTQILTRRIAWPIQIASRLIEEIDFLEIDVAYKINSLNLTGMISLDNLPCLRTLKISLGRIDPHHWRLLPESLTHLEVIFYNIGTFDTNLYHGLPRGLKHLSLSKPQPPLPVGRSLSGLPCELQTLELPQTVLDEEDQGFLPSSLTRILASNLNTKKRSHKEMIDSPCPVDDNPIVTVVKRANAIL